jgi:hypothetical protein
MAGSFGAVGRILKNALGVLTALSAIVGALALIAATANPRGLAAIPGVYVSGPVAAFLLALGAAAFFEFGLFVIRMRDAEWDRDAPRGNPLTSVIGLLIFTASLVFVVVSGTGWVLDRVADGLVLTDETWIVIGCLALYAVLRASLTIARANLGDMARRVGVEEASWAPDPGESVRHRNMRMVVGSAFILLLLDAMIVLVTGAVAPGERTIYPFTADRTLPAAALWVIGIWTLGNLVTGWMRRRVTALRIRVYTAIAVVTLVPALALDARIPLYPVIAGIAQGRGTIETPFGTISRPGTVEVAAPRLISPRPAAELPQHSKLVSGTAVCVDAPWTFTWARDPAFVRYHLVVQGAGATVPLVDTVTSQTAYSENGCGWVAGSNRLGWHWQVWGIMADGRTSPGSEIRTFDVAPLR